MRNRVTDQDAAVELVRAALIDTRGSAYRHELQTVGVPATDDGDYLAHIHAVADIAVDLPALIANPRIRFNGHTLRDWLAILASGNDAHARWVRSVFAGIPYEPALKRRRWRG